MITKILLFPLFFLLKIIEFFGKGFAYILDLFFGFFDWVVSHYE